ncbi:MAG TPA: hypothetical protein G4O02_06725 [Caldilineae bacterium]|jgi:hypothetical protein|nr:hypothetical protein [Caldilineae bacterium]
MDYGLRYMSTVDAHGRRCLRCRKAIASGEHWIEQMSVDGAYSVAFHVGCWAAMCHDRERHGWGGGR